MTLQVASYRLASQGNTQNVCILSSIQDSSDEIIQNKIDQLGATLLAMTKNLQEQLQELADKINN